MGGKRKTAEDLRAEADAMEEREKQRDLGATLAAKLKAAAKVAKRGDIEEAIKLVEAAIEEAVG